MAVLPVRAWTHFVACIGVEYLVMHAMGSSLHSGGACWECHTVAAQVMAYMHPEVVEAMVWKMMWMTVRLH
jgi:hypothetical protein